MFGEDEDFLKKNKNILNKKKDFLDALSNIMEIKKM